MECRRLVQIFLPALFLLLSCSPIHAVGIENLYSVVIQVDDNSAATRNQHLPQAFAQVIKKVGSSSQILNHHEYVKAAQHLDRFVSHYFYTENAGKYLLTLRFNEQMINQLLNRMERTTLGRARPKVLLWLVLEENNERYFVTNSTHKNVSEEITKLANDYGIPVILPLLDLTERLFLNENDVISDNISMFTQAAQRYSTNTVVLGKSHRAGDTWVSTWRLLEGETDVSWQTQAPDLHVELDAMLNKLADQLVAKKQHAEKYKDKGVTQNITVRVQGIKSASDFTRVLEHLKRLSAAIRVDVGSVTNNQANFVIAAEGGKLALLESLKSSTSFVLDDPTSLVNDANSLDLIYRKNA